MEEREEGDSRLYESTTQQSSKVKLMQSNLSSAHDETWADESYDEEEEVKVEEVNANQMKAQAAAQKMSNKQSRTVSHNIIFTALSPKQGQQEQGPESSLRLTKKVEIKGMPSILK